MVKKPDYSQKTLAIKYFSYDPVIVLVGIQTLF